MKRRNLHRCERVQQMTYADDPFDVMRPDGLPMPIRDNRPAVSSIMRIYVDGKLVCKKCRKNQVGQATNGAVVTLCGECMGVMQQRLADEIEDITNIFGSSKDANAKAG